MNKDRIISLGLGSRIQLGPQNRRIYLMKIDPRDCPSLVFELEALARKEELTKIFVKVPVRLWPFFLAAGYRIEAYVPGFFRGKEDAIFGAFYLDPARGIIRKEELSFLEELLTGSSRPGEKQEAAPSFKIRECNSRDLPRMAAFYGKIFCRYPFAVSDPAFLARGMEEGTAFFGIWEKDIPWALSSAEQDFDALSAEMTDFGVDPEKRGAGLASFLLEAMERAVAQKGIRTAFTIARLKSPGMNKTFFNAGYTYSGTLVNNTYMGTEEDGPCLESMNLWYKRLS